MADNKELYSQANKFIREAKKLEDKDTEKAIDLVKEAIKIRPDYLQYDYFLLARYLTKQGQFEKAKEIFNTNAMSIVFSVEPLFPEFMERKSGMIVGVSTLADSRGFPKSGFYNASKAAATILLESLEMSWYTEYRYRIPKIPTIFQYRNRIPKFHSQIPTFRYFTTFGHFRQYVTNFQQIFVISATVRSNDRFRD